MDCLLKDSRMPFSSLSLVYSWSLSSVTTTVATSPSVMGSMPSSPRSNSTIFSSSVLFSNFCPTDTI